jgi:hypothetical protein
VTESDPIVFSTNLPLKLQGFKMGISESKADYAAVFDPKEYLTDYAQLDEEVVFTIRFMVRALRVLPPNSLILEFGGGPVLYAVATTVPHAREIHFCDYLPANLNEIQRWLDDQLDAHDWTPYLNLVLELEEEGRPASPTAIKQRAAAMRRKVTRISICDALAEAPLGQNVPQYELVVANYCTDVAAATVSEWMQIMRNISTLVKPGGWLLVSVTTGATTNTFVNTPDQKSFPCVDLRDEDICQGFLVAGCDPETFRFDKLAVPTGREYSGLVTAMARKSSN